MTSQQISHYQLKNKLGRGGMGEVWLAVDTLLARHVALKILPGSLVYDDEARLRFQREVKAVTVLNHPNIITVFETGEEGRQLYQVMEYVEGETVRELIEKGNIPVEKSLDIIKQALMGLNAAHNAHIIHRDIKPENLMIRKDGFVKILDFGLAKILDKSPDNFSLTQGIIGTPRYMSPEQAMGRDVDARSDIFSLGAVMYEMLAGRPAFGGDNLHDILVAITSPDLPADIENQSRETMVILSRALQKDRDKRYSSAREMLTDIIALTSGSFEFTTPKNGDEKSIIVLPLSSSDDDRFFSDGITDEIIDRISRLEKFRVMSRAISFRYRGCDEKLQQISGELNVRLALTGTLRKRGDKAKVMVQLVNCRDGFQLWGERFQFTMEEAFDAEEEVASKVVDSLTKEFLHKESEKPVDVTGRVKGDYTSTAREYYLSGLYLFNSYRQEDIFKAVEFFKKAIDTDPGFSTAHAMLSQACLFIFMLQGSKGDLTILETAAMEAETAFRIDPDSPEPYVAKGLLDMLSLDFAASRKNLNMALSINPNHGEALSWLSYLETSCGNAAKGVVLARKAIERDPMFANHYIWLSYALLSQGRFLEASESLDRAIRLDSRNPYPFSLMVLIKVFTNQMDEARLMFDYADRFTEDHAMNRIIKAIYLQKKGDSEVNIPDEDLEIYVKDPDNMRFAADLYALKGDREKVFKALRASIAAGNRNLPFMMNDPLLENYRKDPEFEEIVEELKLLSDELNKS